MKFRIRLFFHELREKFHWKLAYLLPRQTALMAFVRVSASTMDAPGPEYCKAYNAFSKGGGR